MQNSKTVSYINEFKYIEGENNVKYFNYISTNFRNYNIRWNNIIYIIIGNIHTIVFGKNNYKEVKGTKRVGGGRWLMNKT